MPHALVNNNNLRKMFISSVRKIVICLFLLAISHSVFAQTIKTKSGVTLIRNDSDKRVDVFIDGKHFTCYIYPDSLMKSVLYPIRTASGIIITRGFPFESRQGERTDHPHQVGMWLNFGDVNGVDFWNNSNARTPAEKEKMGTILHQKINSITNGKKTGKLSVECIWIMPDGKKILSEKTDFVFHAANNNLRMIDRITTLTALDSGVHFRDNKEGFFALRVARPLEQITNVADRYIGANGKPADKPIVNNEGVTGKFLSSEGKTGDDVFGTRANWASLSGKIENENITIAILDHPKNPNYPAYWFARGYGLFAANPFGQRAYSKERKESPLKEESNFKLYPGQSVTFRYRVLIMSGVTTNSEEIEKQQKRFASEIK